MALVGTDLADYIRLKLDTDYSGYFNPVQINSSLRASLFDIVERKYLELSGQKQFDELKGLVKTNIEVTLKNSAIHTVYIEVSSVTSGATTTYVTAKNHYLEDGQTVTVTGVVGVAAANTTGVITIVDSTSFTIAVASTGTYTIGGIIAPTNSLLDYFHYLQAKPYILGEAVSISNVLTGTTTVITTTTNHNYRNGDSILIENVGGATSVNAEHADIIVINKTKFSIGNYSGTYTSGGTAKLVKLNSCKLRRSQNKGFYAATPTSDFPKYEYSEGVLFFKPAATKAYIDYITVPPVEIDITNSTINLENYYNPKFLYYLINQLMYELSGDNRDIQLRNTASQSLNENP